MPRGFLRRGIRATATLVGVKRRKPKGSLHPDTPERARARLFSPLDPEAVEPDDDCDHDGSCDCAEAQADKTHRDKAHGDKTHGDEAGEVGSRPLPPTGPPTAVLSIVGEEARAALAARTDLPELQEVVPGDERSLTQGLEAGTLVVLDRAALVDGPWAGIEAATGTRLMASLLPLLEDVRSLGGQVVLLDHERPRNVNTNLLVERSDIVLPDTAEVDAALGEQSRSGLMTVLQQVALNQTATRHGAQR